MNLPIARTSFLLLALALTGVAMAAWHQPGPEILSAVHGEGACPLPRLKQQAAVKPDKDLLLLVFGLAQGSRGQQ